MAGRGGKQRVEGVGRETRAGKSERVTGASKQGKEVGGRGTEGEDAGRKGRMKGWRREVRGVGSRAEGQ